MNQVIPLGLSYGDVLLVPQYSEIKSRNEVDLSTQITPHVKLSLPLISINMTDVTGVKMAIALGKLVGLGFYQDLYRPKNKPTWSHKLKKQMFTLPQLWAAAKDISKEPKNWLKLALIS